jgi:phosphoribosyl 1,2-cyclic phosphodiesterase
LHVKLWGTRGTVPTPTPHTTQYGGNTPCVSVRASDGELIILDAGIGLHWLGNELLSNGFAEKGRAHILISHMHWGHIQGLPFFQPMLVDSCQIHLHGYGDGIPLRDVLGRQMEHAYCPVPDFFDEGIGARLTTADIGEDPIQVGITTITPRKVNHTPGISTFGFRLDSDGQSLAYIPDVEYLNETHQRPALQLAEGVDLLIHDAHHTSAEYDSQRGCGHCSDAAAVELARKADVGKLILFHHHPDHGDDTIDDVVSHYSGDEVDVEAASERAEYVLDSR